MPPRFRHSLPSSGGAPAHNRRPKYGRLPCCCPELSAGRRLQVPSLSEAESCPRHSPRRAAAVRPRLFLQEGCRGGGHGRTSFGARTLERRAFATEIVSSANNPFASAP